MEIRTGAYLAVIAAVVLASCGVPRVEHPIIRKPGVVVKCSDFTSQQEVFAAKQQGELTTADMANMDTDGDGIACNEPGTKFADKLRGGE